MSIFTATHNTLFCGHLLRSCSGPNSVVGIETAYGLDRGGERVSPPVQTGPEAHAASCAMGTGSFPGVMLRPGRDVDPSPHSSVEVKNRVELYL
jgi:hypothetical protein